MLDRTERCDGNPPTRVGILDFPECPPVGTRGTASSSHLPLRCYTSRGWTIVNFATEANPFLFHRCSESFPEILRLKGCTDGQRIATRRAPKFGFSWRHCRDVRCSTTRRIGLPVVNELFNNGTRVVDERNCQPLKASKYRGRKYVVASPRTAALGSEPVGSLVAELERSSYLVQVGRVH